MIYKVVLTSKAEKQLRKLDNFTRKTILSWIKKNLYQTTNPRQHL